MNVREPQQTNALQIVAAVLLLTLALLTGPSLTATARHGTAAGAGQGAATQAAKPASPAPSTPQDPSRPPGGRGFGPVPGPSSSRPDFFPWWKDAEIVKQVGLTPTQTANIDKLYERRLKQIQLQIDEFEKQNTELNRLIGDRTVKSEAIELQAQKMMTPKVLIDISRIKMLYEMSLVMTPEQNKKLQDVVQRLREQQRLRDPNSRGRGEPGR